MRAAKANLRAVDDEKGWVAVRRGPIYCAPRCGGGCTWAAHQKATQDAEALAKRLGDGWEPDVWENLGWHWCVRKGIATIYGPQGGHVRYSAWLRIEEPESDRQGQQQCCIIEYAESPEDALGIATQKLRSFARQVEGALNALLD